MEKEFQLDFGSKRVNVEETVSNFFINNGVAHIACNVSGLDDVLNRYGVQGYETLNNELSDYIEGIVPLIGKKTPIVIEITGHDFSEEEQGKIEAAFWNHFELRAAIARKEQKALIVRIIWFAVCFLSVYLVLNNVPAFANGGLNDIGFILLWFFGDRMVDYLLLQNKGTKEVFVRYAQLESVKLIFTSHYEDKVFTDQEANMLCDEVESNIESTEI